jgi:hypothetical protein
LTLDVGDASDPLDIFAVCCGALRIRPAGCQRDRIVRGLKIRRSHFKGEPVWDSRDNGGNSLFMFLAATDWHPVGIVFQILLWPIWLVWLVFSTQRGQKWLEGDDSSG